VAKADTLKLFSKSSVFLKSERILRMKTFIPSELAPRERHHYILGSIGPRPVAFASTVDAQGRPNLAPYSFFNVFSTTPPVLIFSANTRVKDGSLKDTLRNVQETGELVINLVDYNMVRQMALAGVEFPAGVNEFEKSGLTPIPSQLVKPFRVKESPAQYECKLLEVKSLSNRPGAANLIMAEAVLIHIREDVIGPGDKIDPHRMDLVGRLGAFNYCRASGDAVFSVVQPPAEIVLGFDAIPPWVRHSNILTGNELARLAGVTSLPNAASVETFQQQESFRKIARQLPPDMQQRHLIIHEALRTLIRNEELENAWKLILAMDE
jgi:flavin reductase (DIM6/NTAB) family NADH-FMN oxidoreductase RutF